MIRWVESLAFEVVSLCLDTFYEIKRIKARMDKPLESSTND